ncbi:MAG: hypothetical protein HZC25_03825 [Rhodospirillales bacterium]|nr:hypothetical protein [Rhodospirillales bacterium]
MSVTTDGSPPPKAGSAEAKAAYDRRWRRLLDTVALKRTDRMPVVLYATFWLAKYGGVSHKSLMYDYESTKAICERAVLEFDPDFTNNLVLFTAMGPMMEAMGLKTLQWPGHGVAEDMPYQYLEYEYMKAADYPEFLHDPTNYYLKKFLPQVAEVFEGFVHLPPFPTMSGLRVMSTIRAFANPALKASLTRLMAAADEVERFGGHCAAFARRAAELGYPLMTNTLAGNPFDAVADYWRGAIGGLTDMRRHPEQLLAAMDKVAPYMLAQIVGAAKAANHPVIMITTHWPGDTFMSQKQFETFWWAPFKKQLLGFIEAGLIPMVLWEHECDKRLETIADVPAGKCIYWFERTDNLIRAHEIMGDRVALRGGVMASTMVTGKPADVDAEVKHVVDKVWNKGGHLILDCGIGIPDETPIDNVRAMFRAARQYAG